MSTNPLLKRLFAKLFLTATLASAVNACSGDSWKEEVLLHDGQKIVVERTVDRGGRHEIGQSPPIKLQVLSFKGPNGNQIEWRTELSEDLGFADFQPLNVDRVGSNVYVTTWPVGCLAYNKWGRPNPPYIVFKHDGKAWSQIALKDLPAEIKAPNIIFGSPDTKAKQLGTWTVSVDAVREVNSTLEQPEFKTILREKMPEQMMCEKLERYKARWIRPNDPLAKQWVDSQEKK